MEIREQCKLCENSYLISYKCDTCCTNIAYGNAPVHVEFGFSSPLDGSEYDFCDLKCLLAFVKAEIKKGVV